MSEHYVLGADARTPVPADLMTWARSRARGATPQPGDGWARVAEDALGGVRVSTVFIGLDHRFGPEPGPPLVFETMVFGGVLDQEWERYSTWDEAAAGHAALVAAVARSLRWWERLRRGLREACYALRRALRRQA